MKKRQVFDILTIVILGAIMTADMIMNFVSFPLGAKIAVYSACLFAAIWAVAYLVTIRDKII